MKTKFKQLNDELFNSSSIEAEKLSLIRGGKKTKFETAHGDHTHKDKISGDDDIEIIIIIK